MEPSDVLATYCLTRSTATPQPEAMRRRCYASLCFAQRFLKPHRTLVGVDEPWPAPPELPGLSIVTLQLPSQLASRAGLAAALDTAMANASCAGGGTPSTPSTAAEQAATRHALHDATARALLVSKTRQRMYTFLKLALLSHESLRGGSDGGGGGAVLFIDPDVLVLSAAAAAGRPTAAQLEGKSTDGHARRCHVSATSGSGCDAPPAACEAAVRAQACTSSGQGSRGGHQGSRLRINRRVASTGVYKLNAGVLWLPMPSGEASDDRRSGGRVGSGDGGGVAADVLRRVASGDFYFSSNLGARNRTAMAHALPSSVPLLGVPRPRALTDQEALAFHLLHTPGCSFGRLSGCYAWRPMRRSGPFQAGFSCEAPGTAAMLHTTRWWSLIDAIVAPNSPPNRTLRQCAALPPVLSRAEADALRAAVVRPDSSVGGGDYEACRSPPPGCINGRRRAFVNHTYDPIPKGE